VEAKVDRHHARINLQLADAYSMIGRWEDAENALLKELEWDCDTPRAHLLLGNVYLKQSLPLKAADAYLNAIGLEFNNPQAHGGLGFALFWEGRYTEAAQALENALGLLPDLQSARELLVKIYRNHLENPEKSAYHEKLLTDNTGGTIYVVSGLPRSGTSMMMQMLDRGGLPVFTDGVREKDENNPRGYYEHEAVKTLARNKKWLSQAEGKAVKVIAQLLPLLPPKYRYKVIFMERDLNDVLASQRKMLRRLGKRTEDDLYPVKLMETYRQQVEAVKDWAGSRNNVEILYVSHRETLEAPFETALTVNGFLGGMLLPERMAGAVDDRLHREKSNKLS
jgi:tetratricopeptide (TPR) repeat protein